jgi:uncharacterized tellurite resistance protein B-like protein
VSRKRQNPAGAIVIALGAVIAIISYIPVEVWLVLIVVAAVVVIIKIFTRNQVRHPSAVSTLGLSTPSRTSAATGSARLSSPSETVDVDIRPPSGRSIPAAPDGEVNYKVRWLTKGDTVQVAGLEITGGMLYTGLSLKAPNGRQDPALINPSLKVGTTPVDISERRMPYWPSYSEVAPEARRGYLQWLAGGRSDPAADVGYVFLFFYGLERRALIDLQGSPGDAEIDEIAAEVRRLLDIYSHSGSLRSYATNFLAYLSSGRGVSFTSVPPTEYRSFELPLSYRIGLGQFASKRMPLPVEWALNWALVDPLINCRTPVRRCRDEFHRLFAKHYATEFRDGLMLPVNKTKLRVSYRPASAGFLGTIVTRDMGDLPDIGAITGPQKKLQEIVDRCTDELERYSRFLGRNPDRSGSLEGTVLLPVDAWPQSAESAIQELKGSVAGADLITTWSDVLAHFGEKQTITRTAAIQLANELEGVGIGIEPDLISRGRMPGMSDTVVVFSTCSRDQKVLNSASYAAAAVTIEFGCMAAAADGEIDDSEVQHLLNAIDTWSDLDNASRQRLRARLRLNLAQPPALASMRKQIDPLSTESRLTIATLLVNVVKADGVISPSEVKLLETVYKVLQLDPQSVYTALHADEIRKPVETAKRSGRSQVVLDPSRIAHLQEETNRISAVLNEVFTDDESDQTVTTLTETDQTSGDSDSLLGLDREYTSFAHLLLSRPQWSRAELADAAADMHLMLDGALERINDAAFEKFAVAIAEGDDPVEVNQKLMEQIVA